MDLMPFKDQLTSSGASSLRISDIAERQKMEDRIKLINHSMKQIIKASSDQVEQMEDDLLAKTMADSGLAAEKPAINPRRSQATSVRDAIRALSEEMKRKEEAAAVAQTFLLRNTAPSRWNGLVG